MKKEKDVKAEKSPTPTKVAKEKTPTKTAAEDAKMKKAEKIVVTQTGKDGKPILLKATKRVVSGR